MECIVSTLDRCVGCSFAVGGCGRFHVTLIRSWRDVHQSEQSCTTYFALDRLLRYYLQFISNERQVLAADQKDEILEW